MKKNVIIGVLLCLLCFQTCSKSNIKRHQKYNIIQTDSVNKSLNDKIKMLSDLNDSLIMNINLREQEISHLKSDIIRLETTNKLLNKNNENILNKLSNENGN